MKKRLVAVLLVAAMSMSLLTACRDSGENKATVDIEQTDYDPEEEVKNFEFGELSIWRIKRHRKKLYRRNGL